MSPAHRCDPEVLAEAALLGAECSSGRAGVPETLSDETAVEESCGGNESSHPTSVRIQKGPRKGS